MKERDVEAENEALRQEILALRSALAEEARAAALLREENGHLRAVIDALPVGVTVTDAAGKAQIFNAELRRIVGSGPRGVVNAEERRSAYGIYLPDRATPLPPEMDPIQRAMRGEDVTDCRTFIRHAASPEGAFLIIEAHPLRDAGAKVWGVVCVMQDVTEQQRLEAELAVRADALAASEAGRAELIDRLRAALDELETPIIEIWDDVLVLPVIGVVDSRRSAQMTQRLLDEVVRLGARFVLVDWTGVDVIDTQTAHHFLGLVRAVGLVGARCVLTGIRPAVAQALVDLDVAFGELVTLRNLKHGLRYCLQAR